LSLQYLKARSSDRDVPVREGLRLARPLDVTLDHALASDANHSRYAKALCRGCRYFLAANDFLECRISRPDLEFRLAIGEPKCASWESTRRTLRIAFLQGDCVSCAPTPTMQVRFPLIDPRGTWRIAMREITTGGTVEREVPLK